MKINWINNQRKYYINTDMLNIYVNESIELLIKDYEANVIFVSKSKIREINRKFRKERNVTDVISFAVDIDYLDEKFLGDIFICPEIAAKQAKVYKHSFFYELIILVIHGILHLIGFDHEMDKGEMRLIENKIYDCIPTLVKGSYNSII